MVGYACSGPPGAGRLLGDDLGTFHVAATEATNSCGQGALGAPERFDFDVELSRADSEIFWNGTNGGEIRASLAFQVAASVRVEVPVRPPSAPCVLTREDRIAGALFADTSGAITGFDADMRYEFAAEEACDQAELASSGLMQVPCVLSYELAAERTRAPAE